MIKSWYLIDIETEEKELLLTQQTLGLGFGAGHRGIFLKPEDCDL